jgi:threonine dehydratase
MSSTSQQGQDSEVNLNKMSVNWNEIVAAHERIAPRIHRTPVLTSASLNAMAGAELYFKCDNLQKTGSFKIRGATNAIFSLSEAEAAHGVVAPSSGNHAAAVACAAGWRGIPAWIVMPKNAPAVKCRAVEAYGGKITFCEPKVSARAETAARVQAETGAALIHPYDDDRIIAGQATAAKVLLEEVRDLDAVLTPVSGGGLLSGTSIAAKTMRPAIKVFGCEPERADDAYRSLNSKVLQSLESSDTMADGLRASLSPRTFAILQKNVDGILLVSEEEIAATMHLVWERMKIVIEPSSAVALAPLLRKEGAAVLGLGQSRGDGKKIKIGVIFSGGNVELK